MKQITYSIVSRGEILINYSNQTVNVFIRVSGELVFYPPVFYADLLIFKKRSVLSENINQEIIDFIMQDSISKGTKIFFD